MWFSKRSKALKTIEASLLKAKNRNAFNYGSDEDEDIVIDAYNAISEIEKNEYNELMSYLYDFLSDRDEYLRERAVQALGGFEMEKIPEFKDISYNIWSNKNEDNGVRFSALGAWCGFYKASKDPWVLKVLYQLARNRNYKSSFRASALTGIMEVIGDNDRYIAASNHWLKIYTIRNPDEFDASIDWKDLEDLMRKYAPDALEENN